MMISEGHALRLRILGLLVVACLVGCTTRDAGECSRSGKKFFEEGRFKSALKQFELAAEKEPKNARHFKNAAMCRVELAEVDEAIRLLLRAVEIDPDYGLAHKNLAILFHFKGQNALGLKHLDRARALGADLSRRLVDALEAYREE